MVYLLLEPASSGVERRPQTALLQIVGRAGGEGQGKRARDMRNGCLLLEEGGVRAAHVSSKVRAIGFEATVLT